MRVLCRLSGVAGEKKDLDAIKIMTPDHHHAYISIAAMKKGKHVMVHKPISNRMNESQADHGGRPPD